MPDDPNPRPGETDRQSWGYAPPPDVPPGGWSQGAPPGGWSQGAPPGWVPPAPPPQPAQTRSTRLPVRPHPIFLAMCAACAGCGVLAAKAVGNPRVWVFGFVALGWIISLCLHEFAHAAVAWKGGDHSVEGRGYLTLNPVRYMNSQMSIVLPIFIVLIGGIALPGGAVVVDRRFVRTRAMRSLISAAGPLTNLVCALACGLPIALGLVHINLDALAFSGGKVGAFPAALAFLGLLEVTATILNLLPIPGFDGFGIIAPYLKDETVQSLAPIARYAWIGLFLVLVVSARGNTALWNVADHAARLIGVPTQQANDGRALFTFWQKLS